MLEGRPVDRHVAHVGIESRHEIQGLHHRGAVLARLGVVGLKSEVALEATHLFQSIRLLARRVPANV